MLFSRYGYGGTADGYAATNYSISQQGSQFASDARRNFVLVPDEDRGIVDSSIDRTTMLARLRQNTVVLTAVVNIRMVGRDGSQLLAIAKNAQGASASALAAALTQALLTVNTDVAASTSGHLQESAIEFTSQQEIRSAVRTTVSTIGNRLRNLRGDGSDRAASAVDGSSAVPPLQGLSGGNGANAIGLWADHTYGHLRSTRGASATLYGGSLVTDWLQASVQATLGRLQSDIEQTTLAATIAYGDSRSDRHVLRAALAAFNTFDAVTLTGIVGYNRAREGFDSDESSDGARVNAEATRLGQIQLGTEAAYSLEKGQAYVSAMWEWGVVHSGNGDHNGAVLGAGFRSSAMENLELGPAATAEVARRDERQFTLGANIRYSF